MPIREDRSPNLDYIDLAADAIAPVLVSGNVVILELTSPVGTTGRLADRLARLRPDLRFPPTRHAEPIDVHVAHCPERVLPGRMVRELIENDRIIGGMTEACAEHAELLPRFSAGEGVPDLRRQRQNWSSLSKNALATINIAFANELSPDPDELGLNVWHVIELANRHPRVPTSSWYRGSARDLHRRRPRGSSFPRRQSDARIPQLANEMIPSPSLSSRRSGNAPSGSR